MDSEMMSSDMCESPGPLMSRERRTEVTFERRRELMKIVSDLVSGLVDKGVHDEEWCIIRRFAEGLIGR